MIFQKAGKEKYSNNSKSASNLNKNWEGISSIQQSLTRVQFSLHFFNSDFIKFQPILILLISYLSHFCLRYYLIRYFLFWLSRFSRFLSYLYSQGLFVSEHMCVTLESANRSPTGLEDAGPSCAKRAKFIDKYINIINWEKTGQKEWIKPAIQ